MSEPKPEYDTDTEDSQPTPGPWMAQENRDGSFRVEDVPGAVRVTHQVFSNSGAFTDEAKANARLIAAAGTAASELPDEYDAVSAVEALPFLLSAARQALRAEEPVDPRTWRRLSNAIAAARGDTDE